VAGSSCQLRDITLLGRTYQPVAYLRLMESFKFYANRRQDLGDRLIGLIEDAG
jgi:hypothetical protein